MTGIAKIHPAHLEHKAVVYVRQSSPQQVENNLESQKRQYALRERARALGWHDYQITVIDDDLGISGARSGNRPGYQKLVSMMALREVGVVFGIEVSRLARNCLDWYQLLELASAFGSLIADEDTVYDPADFNDRLLLGLKGTISEVELHQIKVRMMRGRLNKALRGELELRLPIGYERDDEGRTRMTADQAARGAVEMVFHLFARLRSVRGTLLELRRRGMEMPYWRSVPGLGSEVSWRPPVYEAIYQMVRNPTYAGLYVYGRRKRSYDPVQQATTVQAVDRDKWEIVLPDHHPGYVTQGEWEANLETLRNNTYAGAMSQGNQGAPREGSALLQGLVFCKRCGLKMRPRYATGRSYYYCDRDHRRRGDPVCSRASAVRVDETFEELLLAVLNEGTVDLTFELARKRCEETVCAKKQWERKLARLEYEANLARRRYQSVDPENRMVAATLEREWNTKLEAYEHARSELEARFRNDQSQISVKEVKAALRELPERWRSGAIALQDKKELIRCVVERVFLDARGKSIRVEVAWHGGSLSELEVPKYVFTSGRIYHRVVALAVENTDGEIADMLNRDGVRTVKGKEWTARRVMDFRLSNGIPSGFTRSSSTRLPDSGHLTSNELAKRLDVKVETIQRWFRDGIVEGRLSNGLWIHVDEDILRRLDGSSTVDSEAITLRRLARDTGKPLREIVAWARAQGHELRRVRRGKSTQFYVQPARARQRAS